MEGAPADGHQGEGKEEVMSLKAVDNCVEAGLVLDDSDGINFVMDSLAGDTIIEDSQVDFSDSEVDAASALMHLQATEVSTFKRDWEIQYVSSTMFPVMFPHWYGLDHHSNDAATSLVWLSSGYAPSMLGVHEEVIDDKAFEEVIVPMWKLAYPLFV